MKKLLFLLVVLLTASAGFAQTINANHFNARKSIKLAGKKVTHIMTDTLLLNATDTSLVTARAVKKYVTNAVSGGGGGGGGLSQVYHGTTLTGQGTIANPLDVATGGVGSTQITDASIASGDLANNAVTLAKVQDIATARVIGRTTAGAGDPEELSAGAGIVIANLSITNTGDTNAADDLTTASTAGGDLSGTFSNLQIGSATVGSTEITDASIATGDLANNSVTLAKVQDIATARVLGRTTASAGDPEELSAGVGIVIANLSITNTGDTDATNDITTATTAGGDLDGTFPNPTVDALQGRAVSSTAPGTGEVLKWNGSVWAPASDIGGGSGDNWGSQVVVTDGSLTGTGITGNALGIASGGVATAHIAADAVTFAKVQNMATARVLGRTTASSGDVEELSAGAGIAIANLSITNTGDTNAADDLTTASTAGGDLSGTFSNLQIGVGTVGQTEIATSGVSTLEIADGSIAGGDIADDAVTFGKIQEITTARVLGRSTAATGNIEELSAGAGIAIANLSITNTGDTDASNDLTTSTTHAGDVSGAYNALSVDKIKGRTVAATAPTDQQVLKWNNTSSQWEPAADVGGGAGDNWGSQVVQTDGSLTGNGTAGSTLKIAPDGVATSHLAADAVTFAKLQNVATARVLGRTTASSGDVEELTAGTGIAIASGSITNTGDTNAADDLTTASTAGGDLSGTFSNLQIGTATVGSTEITDGSIALGDLANDAVTYAKMQNMTTARVLGRTTASAGDVEELSAGAGISIASGSITNTGDTDASNDLTTATTHAGDVSGAYNALSVDKIKGRAVAATAPTDQQVLKWNNTNSQWEPAADVGGGAGDNWGSQVVQTDGSLTGNGTAGSTLKIAPDGVATSHLAADAVTFAKLQNVATARVLGRTTASSGDVEELTAGTGIAIASGSITNTGDTNAADDLTTASTAGGDLSGTFSNLQIGTSTVGSTEITDASIASGDLANDAVTYAKMQNMTTARVLGRTTASAGDVEELSAGAGISITSGSITNTGDTDASNDLTTATTHAGDVSGAYNALSVDKIKGRAVAATAPTNNQVIKWNNAGSQWEPGTVYNQLVRVNGNDQTQRNAVNLLNGSEIGWIVNDDNAQGETEVTAAISNGSIAAVHLAANAVETDELATGAITTAKINANAVTYDKMQDVTAARLLGRYAGTNGDAQEISLGANLNLDSATGVLTATGDGGGTPGGTTTGDLQLRNSAGTGFDAESDLNYLTGSNWLKLNTGTFQLTNGETTGTTTTDGSLVDIATRDLRIRNLENAAIRFQTNGTERVTISGDGKVGVGQSSPTGMLHINASSTVGAVVIDLPSSTSKARLMGASGVSDWFAVGANMSFTGSWVRDDNTKAGWTYKMDCRTGTPEIAYYHIPAGGGAEMQLQNIRATGISVGKTAIGYGAAAALDVSGNNSTDLLYVQHQNPTGTQRLKMTNAGDMIIGAGTPAKKLEINASGESGLRMTNMTSTYASAAGKPTGVNATGDLITVAAPRVVAKHLTDAATSGTGETDLVSYTSPASGPDNLSLDGDGLYKNVGGSFVGDATTKNVRVRVAGTEVFSTGDLVVSSNEDWSIECEVVRTSSTTARVTVKWQSSFSGKASTVKVTALTGLSFAGTNIVKVTGQVGGAGGAQVVGKMGRVVFMPTN